MRDALASTPAPLTEGESRALSWAGATERFSRCVAEAVACARAPTVADELAHLGHRVLSAHHGYAGDALRKYVFESGPVSRQRWLHCERRYRRSTSAVEVVEKSVAVCPVVGHEEWRQRYAEGRSSWTARFTKRQK